MNIPVDKSFLDDIYLWLEKKAKEYSLNYLLAHADDGVIWGHFNNNGKLLISGDAFDRVKVELRTVTLQQLRLFGNNGELLIWRDGTAFSARILIDEDQADENSYTDEHLLWGEGDAKEKSTIGFTLMQEGTQGFFHAPPLPNAEGANIKLKIRHYIDYDDQGQAYFSKSRLVGLERFWRER